MNLSLPLTTLELTRSARQRTTFALRLIAPTIVAIVLVPSWTLMTAAGSTSNEFATFSGPFIGWTVVLFQAFTAFLIAPLVASGTIAGEKEERTLHLLLMADMRGADVLLSKWIAAFVRSEMLVLSCLPLQAIAALFGGITLQTILHQLVIASLLCLAVTGIGLASSTLCRRTMDAFLVTMGILLIWAVGESVVVALVDWLTNWPLPLGQHHNPWLALVDTMESGPGVEWYAPWPAVVQSAVVAASAFALAALTLPRAAVDRGSSKASAALRRGRRRPIGDSTRRVPWRILALSPVGRIYASIARASGARMLDFPWSVAVIVVTCLVGVIPFFNIVAWIAPIVIVYDVASCLAAGRRSGALELLYITDETSHQLAADIARTHLVRGLVFLPNLVISSVMSLFFYSFMYSDENYSLLLIVPLALVQLIMSAARLLFFVSLGCLCATWTGTPVTQTIRAFVLYIGFSMFLGCLTGIGSSLAMSVPLAMTQNNTGQMLAYLIVTAVQGVIYISLYGVIIWACFSSFRSTLDRKWRTGLAAISADV